MPNIAVEVMAIEIVHFPSQNGRSFAGTGFSMGLQSGKWRLGIFEWNFLHDFKPWIWTQRGDSIHKHDSMKAYGDFTGKT